MGQLIFFLLFILTLLAGTYAYFTPSHTFINPMASISEKSPYSVAENFSRKEKQNANITTNKGLVQIHFQMKDLARKQKRFSDMLLDQQQVLQDTGRLSSQILAEVQQQEEGGEKDVLRLKTLAMELQDDQRLLVAHGQELIDLNDQITQDREGIQDQMDLIHANNTMTAKSEQQELELSRDVPDDLLKHNQELIEEARQKIQDQQRINQQQAQDQAQKIQDQQEQESVYQQKTQDQIQRMKDQQEQINR